MVQPSLKSRISKVRQSPTTAAFTLIELLIASVVGAITVSALIGLAVQMIRVDLREAALTETQRDMKRALDFIASDLREAVYVYPGGDECNTFNPNSCPPYANYVGTVLDNKKPILAFWRTDPVDENKLGSLVCNSFSDDDKKGECEALKRSRHTLTLVIYTQQERYHNWNGKSVIRRFQLRRYSTAGISTLTTTSGYVNPVARAQNTLGGSLFSTWPLIGDPDNNSDHNLQGSSRPDARGNHVLVDYVDDFNHMPNGRIPECDYSSYTRSPARVAQDTSTSFFACIKDVGQDVGKNQDVILYLRGNARGRGGEGVFLTDDDGRLPMLKTQVSLRGIIDKF